MSTSREILTLMWRKRNNDPRQPPPECPPDRRGKLGGAFVPRPLFAGCVMADRTTQFQKGDEPWNKGLKGIHLSPKSEFKKGCDSNRRVDVGTVTIRHRKREKNPRAWIKVAEPSSWVPLARYVYEAEHGPLDKGLVIHHIDRNPLNDSLENLVAMTRREHALEHEHDLRRAKYA